MDILTRDEITRRGLLAGTGMGLLDGEVLARLGLPIRRERLVDLLVQLARGIIGDVEELGGVSARRRAEGHPQHEAEGQQHGKGVAKAGEAGHAVHFTTWKWERGIYNFFIYPLNQSTLSMC